MTMWNTYGYNGTWRGQRSWWPCKEMVGMYQGIDTRPAPQTYRQAVGITQSYGSVMNRPEIFHERQYARYINNDGYISADVRIFNMFTPPQMHRRDEYIDPTASARMQSPSDYAASIVASGFKLQGGGIG